MKRSRKDRALWKVSIHTTAEAEEALAEVLERGFSQPACAYSDAKRSIVELSVYLRSAPEWGRTKRDLRAGLNRVKASGLDIGAGKITLAKIRGQNWRESWKRHFRPLEIGPSLLIKPSWSKRLGRTGQAVIVLDPGLSFGTGHHPTTAFCLRALVAHRQVAQRQSFLDLGTGSGILAIAAASLGYGPIEALDSDPEAIRVARANARSNRVAGRIRFRLAEIGKMGVTTPSRFSVVCANLSSNLLVEKRANVLGGLEPRGILVLAGILKAEFGAVRKAYEAAGLRLRTSRQEKEWKSGTFV